MATAVVLQADGRREGGRWRRGSVQVGNDESVITGGWAQRLKEAGVILDYAPDLAFRVTDGSLALSGGQSAHSPHTVRKTSRNNR